MHFAVYVLLRVNFASRVSYIGLQVEPSEVGDVEKGHLIYIQDKLSTPRVRAEGFLR